MVNLESQVFMFISRRQLQNVPRCKAHGQTLTLFAFYQLKYDVLVNISSFITKQRNLQLTVHETIVTSLPG